MRIAGHPVTALIVVLVLAGVSPFAFAKDERFGIALLVLAGIVAILAIIEAMRKKRGNGGQSPPEGGPGLFEGPVGSVGQTGGSTTQINKSAAPRPPAIFHIEEGGSMEDTSFENVTATGPLFHNEGSLKRTSFKDTNLRSMDPTSQAPRLSRAARRKAERDRRRKNG